MFAVYICRQFAIPSHVARNLRGLPRVTIAALCTALTLFGVTPARAETAGPSAADDLYYTFDDDLLDAVGNDAMGAMLHIRPGAARTLLIRPRVQFVDELLSTIEQM